jgi:hypothetical protein
MKAGHLQRVGVVLLLVVLTYGAIQVRYRWDGPFSVTNARGPSTLRYEATELSRAEMGRVHEILHQPYSYLGKGGQCYVFLSADGRYVLKFAKCQRYRPEPWLEALSWFPPVGAYRDRLARHKEKRLDAVYRSWKLAFDHLREETGLVYVHLDPRGAVLGETIVIDEAGTSHSVAMDQMQFLVQRRVEMLGPTLKRLVAQGEMEQARRLTAKLATLISKDREGALCDLDTNVVRNTGLHQEQLVCTDVGMVGYLDSHLLAKKRQDKVRRSTHFLRRLSGELAGYFQQAAATQMAKEDE